MIYIIIQNRDLLIVTTFAFINRSEVIHFGQFLNRKQACVATDRLCILTHQLHTVIVHRVMACCNLDPTIHIEMECGKVNFFCST
ncbi:hypothetical protein D3C77_520140 [compost metagenome]